MKKYLYIILAITIALMPLLVAAKGVSDLTKGDYFFRHRGYNKALSYYETISQGGSGKRDKALHTKMADCYRLTNRPNLAAYYYSKALTEGKDSKGITKEMKFHYGEVLMTLGCYSDAAVWLREYLTEAPDDRRAANMIVGCETAPAYYKNIPEGVETFLPVNTELSDYGPSINNQYLVFSSDTTPPNFITRDKFSGDYFYKIYQVTTSREGKCDKDVKILESKGIGRFHDANAVFTNNGQTMYFTRSFLVNDIFGPTSVTDDNNTVHLQIMIAEDYDQDQKKYKKVTPFQYNNKVYSTAHPALSPDGKTLIFSSDMPGGEGGTDLYICKREADGKWSKPENLGKTINTNGEEVLPVFLSSNTISFTSNGHPGLGGLDVFYTTWSDQTKNWSRPENAGIPVNSPYDDMSLTMHEDNQNGFFASNRPAEKGSDNIYHFYHQKLFLKLNVVDSISKEPIPEATITLLGVKDKYDLKADNNGRSSTIITPHTVFKVTVNKKGYKELITSLSTADLKRLHEVDTFSKTLKLIPEEQITLTARILDEETRKPIENPLITISKDGSNFVDTINMATGMPINRTLEPNTVYHINAIKDNYYSDEKVISTNGLTGVIHLTDSLLMCELRVGVICQIESIYYDFDKATIRKDALPSLDKLIRMMHTFPKLTIQLNSHTDCRGTNPYNLRLSKARAESVVKYLIQKGIAASRLQSKGYGATKPVYKCDDCKNCDEIYRQKNRRTEFMVLSM